MKDCAGAAGLYFAMQNQAQNTCSSAQDSNASSFLLLVSGTLLLERKSTQDAFSAFCICSASIFWYLMMFEHTLSILATVLLWALPGARLGVNLRNKCDEVQQSIGSERWLGSVGV